MNFFNYIVLMRVRLHPTKVKKKYFRLIILSVLDDVPVNSDVPEATLLLVLKYTGPVS
jgi:hypothetical protein